MIANTGAGGGSGGLSVIARGVVSVVNDSTVVNFPRAAQFLIMDGVMRGGRSVYGAILLRPGQNGEINAKVSFAANGQSVSFSNTDGWGYDMSYIAFG